ncbi:MAG: transcriptional regulator NrdR [Cardiobacterium hominis]|nr:transcriptional regulator NrdR [Cardiobacterium hominis]SAM71012.1 Ribonucleotide reductase transcriptional regulator NrdR [Cardiobacterium hominis]VEG77441.1 Transcriptional repressor NrdR [Cardiobacterium hominis]
MHCPICHRPDTRVIDSRLISDGSKIRRRRECTNPACATRFTTYETAEISLPMVIKQNGERQAFSAEKLRNGLLRAIEKRPVSVNKINQLIEDIENRLRISGDREVASRKIGEWVMAGLKNIDHVAYIRFASVYLSFQDVEAFINTIAELRRN